MSSRFRELAAGPGKADGLCDRRRMRCLTRREKKTIKKTRPRNIPRDPMKIIAPVSNGLKEIAVFLQIVYDK